MKTETITQFINAINHHDLEAIAVLMDREHLLIDANGTETFGSENILKAWKNYFGWFPDYTIQIDKLVHHGNTIVVLGFAEGTFYTTNSSTKDTHWKVPAAWNAIVVEDKIKLWQVYADTKLPADIISKHANAIPANDTKVNGLGGVFFKSKNPKKLCAWYDTHLGTSFGANTYSTFKWRERNNPDVIGRTEFSIFSEKSDYFAPSKKPFMLNFRVRNLDIFLNKLKAAGVKVNEKVERFDYGNFGWIEDLEGNKIELWEPVDKVLEEYDAQ